MSKPPDSHGQLFLPRYEIKDVIGEGAAAVIYRVTDRHDGATKAIKALKSAANAEASVVKRFEDEYRILRRLHHPSLPEVYDYGFTAERSRYMVMELVDGVRLDAYFEENPADVWLLLYELCEVLSFIHSHDLLHLDLKPANILVKRTSAYGDDKPMVVLLDFGLSYRRDAGAEVSLVGTPEYMAPEIISGGQELTRAADYYSLGISLYKLLVGETPFQGTISDIFSAHLRKEVRFREEKTEYAELYPHVLGLVAKTPRSRLEAFEDFRRAVAGRLGGGIDELDRAYGMSFISSMGMIGKDEVWQAIEGWLSIGHSHPSHAAFSRDLPVDAQAQITPGEPGEKQEQREADSFIRSIENRLLSGFRDRSAQEHFEKTPGRDVLLLGGPPRSGVTYVINELVSRSKLHGIKVWKLKGESSENVFAVESAISWGEDSQSVTSRKYRRGSGPETILIERYIDLWNELVEKDSPNGAILVVDGLTRLKEEDRAFLHYVGKRMSLSVSEGKSAYLSLVIADHDPKFAGEVSTYLELGVELQPLTLRPPNDDDIQSVISQFRGKMVKAEDYQSLREFVSRYDDSTGTIFTAMQDAVLKESLSYKRGRWQFSMPVENQLPRRSELLRSYYKSFITELTPCLRVPLEWICCHTGPVSITHLQMTSEISHSDIQDAASALEPYRILDTYDVGEIQYIRFASDNTREAIYQNIEIDKRHMMHKRYVSSYTDLLSRIPPTETNRRVAVGLQLAHQYRALNQQDDMIRAHLGVLRILKDEKRHYESRRVAETGLEVLASLGYWKRSHDGWYVHRFYVKTLTEALWASSDYHGIRRLLNKYFDRREIKPPVSFTFKYCMSLAITGEYDLALGVLERVKKSINAKTSEPYVVVKLVEAVVHNYKAEYDSALDILRYVEKHKAVLGKYTTCRLFHCYASVYERMGNGKQMIRYNRLLEQSARESGYTHELLSSITIWFNHHFDNSMLAECMALVRRGIQLSSRAKLYYQLSRFYFLASAVYYEQGNYRSAVRYVEKALRLAINLGLADDVPDLLIRMGMNYQNMGLFGNAIAYRNKAWDAWREDFDPAKRVVLSLFDFDIHLNIGSRYVDEYRKRLRNSISNFRGAARLGYYWRLEGIYLHKKTDIDAAVRAFKKARDYYGQSGMVDDVVRTYIAETVVYIESGRSTEARQAIRAIAQLMNNIESANISADYLTAVLAYHYYYRSGHLSVKEKVLQCEEAMKYAKEVPLLLKMERLIIRTKMRLGDREGANRLFSIHLRRVKSIISNMPNQEYAADFLNQPDEKLLLSEYRIAKR